MSLGGFQVGAFQTAFQQVATATRPGGWKSRRHRNVEEEIRNDDEEVMAFLHASLPDLIDKFWRH